MTEDELRAMVRAAVAAHLGGGGGSALPSTAAALHTTPLSHQPGRAHRDASHALFVLPGTADGTCIIEPAVACTHCGFCKSYGH